jgi:acyl-CoA thioesterase-1
MNWVFKLATAMPRLCLASSLLVVALSVTPAGAGAAPHPIKILAFGTSLTQGYGLPPGTELPVLLEAMLKRAHVDATVINAGVSGDTTADGLSRLDWSLADNPDAAIVEFGGNDALRGLPPDQIERNLSVMIEKLRARRIPVLLLGMMAPRNYGPEYAAQFDAIYPRLAKRYATLFYPFVLSGVAMQPKLNQADGIHPNPAGEKIIAGLIFPDVMKLARAAQIGSH